MHQTEVGGYKVLVSRLLQQGPLFSGLETLEQAVP